MLPFYMLPFVRDVGVGTIFVVTLSSVATPMNKNAAQFIFNIIHLPFMKVVVEHAYAVDFIYMQSMLCLEMKVMHRAYAL